MVANANLIESSRAILDQHLSSSIPQLLSKHFQSYATESNDAAFVAPMHGLHETNKTGNTIPLIPDNSSLEKLDRVPPFQIDHDLEAQVEAKKTGNLGGPL